MKELQKIENKKFAPIGEKERIFRKTIEIIGRSVTEQFHEQKAFTTKPKTHRIRRGHTIVIRRCKNIMKHLYQCGHKHIATTEDIKSAIFFCAGGDYRTAKRYMGFTIYSKGSKLDPPRPLRYIKGYLERLRFIEKVGGGKYRLNHVYVPLNYHYREELVPPSSSPLQTPVNVVSSKHVLCVSEGSMKSTNAVSKFDGEGAIAPIQTNKTNKHNTHTNRLSESIRNIDNAKPTSEELRILEASRRRAQ